MWVFSVILFIAAVVTPGFLRLFFVVFGFVILASYLFPGDKPTEFDADVWCPNNEERASNLKAKIKARRAGQTYFSRAAAAKIDADSAAAPAISFTPADVAGVAAEPTKSGPVYRHPMRPATWK